MNRLFLKALVAFSGVPDAIKALLYIALGTGLGVIGIMLEIEALNRLEARGKVRIWLIPVFAAANNDLLGFSYSIVGIGALLTSLYVFRKLLRSGL